VRLRAETRERLDRFLARKLPGHSRSRLQRLISAGGVRVAGEVAEKSGLELREGWIVELEEPTESPPHDLEPAEIALDVLYEDDDVLVVNKPRGLATHPAASLKEPSLVNALLARSHGLSRGTAPYRPGIVHRLDKDTTGLIVVAKTDAAHVSLARQIEARTVSRLYVALVRGEPMEEAFTVDAPVGRHPGNPTLMAVKKTGKRAVTHVRTLARLGADTLVLCRLETGRTHQIRVHLAACHLPVVGDPLYAPAAAQGPPLQLHAARLSFEHPTLGTVVSVYAPPPDDFVAREEVVAEEVEGWD
jgi:23S rRNA pseudouridine1911/1915/1917 synthase